MAWSESLAKIIKQLYWNWQKNKLIQKKLIFSETVAVFSSHVCIQIDTMGSWTNSEVPFCLEHDLVNLMENR